MKGRGGKFLPAKHCDASRHNVRDLYRILQSMNEHLCSSKHHLGFCIPPKGAQSQENWPELCTNFFREQHRARRGEDRPYLQTPDSRTNPGREDFAKLSTMRVRGRPPSGPRISLQPSNIAVRLPLSTEPTNCILSVPSLVLFKRAK